MTTEHQIADLRNALQAGVLIVDALLARQQELADQAEAWIRLVAGIGGTVDIEPITRVAEPFDDVLDCPFVLMGQIYRVLLDVDGRTIALEVLCRDVWHHLGVGHWDGLHVELEDGGEALAPSCTAAVREALALWRANR